METNRKTVEWLRKQTKAQHLRLLGLVAGNASFSAVSVLLALTCRAVIDSAVAGEQGKMRMSACAFLGIITLQLVLWIWTNRSEELIRSGTGMDLRNHMAEQLLKKEYGAVKEKHSGEWMNRMFSDVQVISEGIVKIIPGSAGMLTKLFCAVGVLLFLQPLFAGIFMAGGLFLIICTGVFRRKLKLLHREVQEKQGRVQSFLQELVQNLLVVKVFGEEKDMEARVQALQREHFAAQIRRRNSSIFANAGFSFIFQIGYFATLCWGARGLYRGNMSYGTLAALLQLVGQIQAPVANLSGILPQIYGTLASAERVMELEEYPEEQGMEPQADPLKESQAKPLKEPRADPLKEPQADPLKEPQADLPTKLPQAPPEEKFEGISVRSVDFFYGSGSAPVLEQVSFTVRRGETVALTGLSGSGKSTVFLLLLGIYRAGRGEIVIETSKRRLPPGIESRPLFSYVPQGNGLFSGTIRENIQFGKQKIPEQKLWEALEAACAGEFVENLPLKLDTVVGEKGLGLSEGQSQRLAIARAILRDTPVILLDEATSALDGATEAAVLKHVKELKNRTCLIVTHREAALKICGKQLLFDSGTVTERRLEKDL